MAKPLPSRLTAACLILVASLALSACSGGEGLQGTYHSAAGGAMALDFKGEKVMVTLAGERQTLDYKVEGDTVTILNPREGDLVLTINSDGSINSPLGTFVKKAN
jgi:hypothetical protein